MVFKVYGIGSEGADFRYPCSSGKQNFKYGNIAKNALSGIISLAEVQ